MEYVTLEKFQTVCLALLDAQNRIVKLEAEVARLLAVRGGR